VKSENFTTATGNLTVTSPLLPDLEEFHGLLKEIWASKWVTNMGRFHRQLERALAEYLKVPYLSLFTNGTLPLLTALQALLGFEDDVTVVAPGINSKMDEVRCAYGLLNLKQVDAAIEARRKVASKYVEALKDVRGIRMFPYMLDSFGYQSPLSPGEGSGVRLNYSYFPIFVNAKEYGMTRDALYFKLQAAGVYGRRYFYPLISTFSTYRSLPSAAPTNLPVATRIADEVICLPMHHAQNEDIERVIRVIRHGNV